MGISALQSWKPRWFHLRGPWLCYCKSQSDNSVVKDRWNLTNATIDLVENDTGEGTEIIMNIQLDVSIPVNANNTTKDGVLLLRHYKNNTNTAFNIQAAALEWKNAMEFNIQTCNQAGRPVVLWHTQRSEHSERTERQHQWSTKYDERCRVDAHVLQHTELRVEEYGRLVVQAKEDEQDALADDTLGVLNTFDSLRNHRSTVTSTLVSTPTFNGDSAVLARQKSRQMVPLIPPSPSKPPPPGSNFTRKNSIVREEDDDEVEDAAMEKNDAFIDTGYRQLSGRRQSDSDPLLIELLENVTKRKGVTGVEFFGVVNQRKKDGNMIYRQQRVVVVTLTHLFTYKLNKSKKKWHKSKTLLLSTFYKYQHAYIRSDVPHQESIHLRTKSGATFVFTGQVCGVLSAAIRRTTGMVHRHPHNIWRAVPHKGSGNGGAKGSAKGSGKGNTDKEDAASDNEVEQKGEDEEDLGCVSDSYNGGAATDGDDDEEDGEGGSEGGSEGGINGAGGKTTAAATAALLKHRYIKDMYGTLGVSARLKNIGKIQFCGLLLQDKGQGWKQRRMVVLTSTKLLTYKLNSSAKTVRLWGCWLLFWVRCFR